MAGCKDSRRCVGELERVVACVRVLTEGPIGVCLSFWSLAGALGAGAVIFGFLFNLSYNINLISRSDPSKSTPPKSSRRES